MGLKELTPQERSDALEKAAKARAVRAAAKEKLKGLGIHQARALVDFMDTQQSV